MIITYAIDKEHLKLDMCKITQIFTVEQPDDLEYLEGYSLFLVDVLRPNYIVPSQDPKEKLLILARHPLQKL